jgi:hypothetical protein
MGLKYSTILTYFHLTSILVYPMPLLMIKVCIKIQEKVSCFVTWNTELDPEVIRVCNIPQDSIRKQTHFIAAVSAASWHLKSVKYLPKQKVNKIVLTKNKHAPT